MKNIFHYKQFEGFLFAFDDVLVDRLPGYYSSLNELLRIYELPPLSRMEYELVNTSCLHTIVNDAFEKRGESLLEHKLALCTEQMQLIYRSTLAYNAVPTPKPGASDILALLSYLKCKVAIVSRMPELAVRNIIEQHHWHHCVATVIGGDTLGIETRKSALISYACVRLSVNPVNCMFIGNKKSDIDAAHDNSMPTVTVKRFGNPGPPDSKAGINDLRLLLKTLDSGHEIFEK